MKRLERASERKGGTANLLLHGICWNCKTERERAGADNQAGKNQFLLFGRDDRAA